MEKNSQRKPASAALDKKVWQGVPTCHHGTVLAHMRVHKNEFCFETLSFWVFGPVRVFVSWMFGLGYDPRKPRRTQLEGGCNWVAT